MLVQQFIWKVVKLGVDIKINSKNDKSKFQPVRIRMTEQHIHCKWWNIECYSRKQQKKRKTQQQYYSRYIILMMVNVHGVSI